MAFPRTVHPFPARMASEVALNALEGLQPGSTVLDPMCGSGVVVRRALDCGHLAIGLDIDPLAVLMTKVWTSKLSLSIRPHFGQDLIQKAKPLMGTKIELPWIDHDENTTELIRFWFARTQRKQIRALLAASRHLRGQRRDLVDLALSRIIVTKSKGASLAADTSHSRPHRVRSDNDFDVLTGFAKSLGRLLRILKESPVGDNGKVRLGDAQSLKGIRTATVDAVITSPPYMNAIDYLRGHKLALVWLGYAAHDIHNIRAHGVGAPAQPLRGESDQLNAIVQTASDGTIQPSTEKVVRRYAHDMMACLKQTHRVIRSGGYAVYVVSNSVLHGVEVDTARVIVDAASNAGFQLEDRYTRDIPREHRYLPPPQATANHQLATRMRTESVLRFRKITGQD